MPFENLPVELATMVEDEIATWRNPEIAPLALVSRSYRQTFTRVLYRTVVLPSARSISAFSLLAQSAHKEGDQEDQAASVLTHVRSLSIWRGADERDWTDYWEDGIAIVNACPNLLNLQLSPLSSWKGKLFPALQPRFQRLYIFDMHLGSWLLGDSPAATTLNNRATHLHIAGVDSFIVLEPVSPLAFPCLTVFSTSCANFYALHLAERIAQAIKNVLALPTLRRVVVHLACLEWENHKASFVWNALRELDDVRVFYVRNSFDFNSNWREVGLDMWRRDVTGEESMWEVGEQICSPS
ncbi:hypothetical protein AURDEDRAFT_186590 [Auricularia subglabra TFB-10046 SS5]|uniref:F-box domain-containing protein n=1 Tax=Auricularia subglabra (strain TFB-10046 / SS5) TaxID=717982 RepID=J0D2X8_AURST|nr:hypothetical protein AURDEDRAFT_186590 [Auricularia subglabra TFB-10046 SS5]